MWSFNQGPPGAVIDVTPCRFVGNPAYDEQLGVTRSFRDFAEMVSEVLMEAFTMQLDCERIEQGEFAGVPTLGGTVSLDFVDRRFGIIDQRQGTRACSRTKAPVRLTLPPSGRNSPTAAYLRHRALMFSRHDEMAFARFERIGFTRTLPR